MKEKIILKSTHPSDYPNLEVECRVIPNDKIGEYLSTIPEERKFYAHKTGCVKARRGIAGLKVETVLKTTVDGKEYILSEEENIVKERESNGEKHNDIVVINISSTSKEIYVVKYDKFIKTYISEAHACTGFTTYRPVVDSRLLTQVDENVVIMTSWGAPAVCLAGSYIVTYDADNNDYNTLEKGAFESTYTVDKQNQKRK